MKIVADENIPFVRDCFASLGSVEVVSGGDIRPETVADVDILIVRSVTEVDSELLEGSNVSFVGTSTIGFDHIDAEYLESRGIGFASAPGSNADSVAEYVTSALLNIADRKGLELAGKSIGIIGVGNVGSRVEKKTVALGMKPVLNDPPLERKTGARKYRPLEELYDCDFITLHTQLTFEGEDKTFHLVNEKLLDNLKSGAVLLNTSRGAVVDSTALKQSLEAEKLSGTVLDVWEDEPDIDTELLEMVVIGTPHIAGYSFDGKVRGMVMIYNAVCEYFGIDKRADESDFLPEPEIEELQIDSFDDVQNEVLKIVNKIYNVCEDDKALRRILNLDDNKRAEFFRKLRREYPVRREFHNFTVKIGEDVNKNQSKLENIISGLGLSVG